MHIMPLSHAFRNVTPTSIRVVDSSSANSVYNLERSNAMIHRTPTREPLTKNDLDQIDVTYLEMRRRDSDDIDRFIGPTGPLGDHYQVDTWGGSSF